MKRWTNGLPGATKRLGANLALRGLSVSQSGCARIPIMARSKIAPLQRPNTLLQLSRSSVLKLRLATRGRAIQIGTTRPCRQSPIMTGVEGRPVVQALKEPIFHHLALFAIAALTIGLSDRLGYRELIPLRMQFPGLRGACLANRPADRSRLPSTQGDCFRLGWEASSSDPMARSRASPRSRAPWRGRCSR